MTKPCAMEGVGALGGGEQQDLPRPVGAAGSAYGAAGKVSVRFLVDNHAAGVVIGRNGSNKDELQAQSGASVQLSKPNVFWSGACLFMTSGALPAGGAWFGKGV